MALARGSSFPGNKDAEFSRLKAENQSLQEELAQCQADKDFVWSLWKRLQVANPDITQAVGLVAQRENEKAELKNRKVLEILNAKDDKIDELQALVGNQSKELSEAILVKNELEDKTAALERKNTEMKIRMEELELKVRSQASREAVRELDQENMDLKQELARKAGEIDRLENENEGLRALRDANTERIQILEQESEQLDGDLDSIQEKELENKKQLRKADQQVASLQRELKSKCQEMDVIRSEMADIWATHRQTSEHAEQQAEVIRQLQRLQTDTQQMLQNSESAFKVDKMTIETENQMLRGAEIELKRQLGAQAQTINEQERLLQDLQAHLESKEVALKELQMQVSGTSLNSKLNFLQTEVEELKYKLDNRSRSPSPAVRALSSRSRTAQRRGRGAGGEPGHVRSKSLNSQLNTEQLKDVRFLALRLENTERKLSDTQLLLHLKAKELEEVRSTHNRRLDRLKAVQNDHKLLKKHSAQLEEDLYGPKKPGSKKKLRRSPPKSLQKEDSDQVWNELTVLRKQAKNYQVENVNLSEECDALRVKLTQCEATNHELKLCLEQEKEELQFVLAQQEEERAKSASVEERDVEVKELRRLAQHYRQQLDDMRKKVRDADVEQRTLDDERLQAVHDRRALKAEVNSLRQQISASRITIADLKNEVTKLQRDAARNKKRSRQTKDSSREQVLRRSLERITNMYGDYKDGWEDVSDSDEKVTKVTTIDQLPPHGGDDTGEAEGEATFTTGTSLGEEIAQHAAHNSLHDAHNRSTSTQENTPRVSSTRSVALSPIRDILAAADHRSGLRTRSIALSPIRTDTPRSVTSSTSPLAVGKRKRWSPVSNSRQVSALKQRVTALISQVSVLRSSKESALNSNRTLKSTLEQLETELLTAKTKLAALKNTVTRLSTETDRLKGDKELLEQKIHDISVDGGVAGDVKADEEVAALQQRLKAASTDVSRQLTLIKTLKHDNAVLEDKNTQLHDRIKCLERDNAQKRILAEDMKMKMKVVQENVKSDAAVMDDIERKMRSISELNQRQKTQLDSLKTRLAVVSKEKSDNEDKVIKLTEELDRKSRLVSDLQSRARGLQATVAAVERTAQQQLTTLADHSEVAIDTAQAKLTQMDTQLQEFAKFVKVLSMSLVSSTQQARQFATQQKVKKELARRQQDSLDTSLNKFKAVACDILNISDAELDDIMHCQQVDAAKIQDLQRAEDQKRDKKWCKKWEKLLQCTADFAVPLCDVIMEKVDERCQLASELAVT